VTQGKTLIIALIALVAGVGAGFVLRPMIVPIQPTAGVSSIAQPAQAPVAPRGKQYFEANLDEAQRVIAACKDGSARGNECTNAEQAVVEAEGRDRFKRFMGN
jgi:hypothetical protein